MRLRWIVVLLVILVPLIAVSTLVNSIPTGRIEAAQPVGLNSMPASTAGVFDDNLLDNPSFEGDYYQPAESPPSLVAQGWSVWYVDDPENPLDRIPEWNEEWLIPPINSGRAPSWRVRHGDKSQKMFSSYSFHQGGLYQQVTEGITPGRVLEFSIWAQVWSSMADNPCQSPPGNTGDYSVSVGIDPTGGTDPEADTVQWNESFLYYDIPYDVWNRISVTAIAEANQVTVFTRGRAKWAVKHNDSHWEDAKLTDVTGITPTVTSTVTPTATSTPSATLTPTATTTSAATLTPTATTTSTPTRTPSGLTEKSYLPIVMHNFTGAPAETATPTVTLTPNPACEDLVQNGGFESTGGWTLQSDVPHPPAYTTAQAAGGARSLRLGIPAGGTNAEGWSAAWQAVALPASLDSATLTFEYYPESTDLERDYFEARVLDQSGAPIKYIVHPAEGQSNAQAWLPVQFDLTPYAGQTIQLYFNVYNDGQKGEARVYLDNVQVELCGATAQRTTLHAAEATPPQFRVLQDIPFGQVQLRWARYGRRTPNINWAGCGSITDVGIEWLEAANTGEEVNLAGWTVENDDGAAFTFPDFTLGANQTLRIWTDTRDNGPNDVFMNRAEQFWDDNADRATLRFSNGDLATGELCWYEAGGFPIACVDQNP